MSDLTIRHAASEEDVERCHALMWQLRPALTSPVEFIGCWRRQSVSGYRLLVGWMDDRPVALAGYRQTENLVHGRHFYVDDLVTDQKVRGSGHGAALLLHLKEEARQRGCAQLVLDSGMSNESAHRFYVREGLKAEGLHFSMKFIAGDGNTFNQANT